MVVEWLLDPESFQLFSYQRGKTKTEKETARRLPYTSLCPALCHMPYSFAEKKAGDLDC